MASCSDPPTCCPSSGWRPSTSRCGCSKRRSASARYCSAAPTRSGRSTVSVKAAGVGRSTPVPALPAACCSSRSALLPAASTGTARRCSSPRSPWRCSGSGLLWRVSSPVPAVALPASSRPLSSCSTSSSDFGPRLASFVTGFGNAWRDQNNDFCFWVPIVGPLIGGPIGAVLYDLFVGRHLPVSDVDEEPGRTLVDPEDIETDACVPAPTPPAPAPPTPRGSEKWLTSSAPSTREPPARGS